MKKEILLAIGGLDIGFGIAELVQTIRIIKLNNQRQKLEQEKRDLTLRALEEERKLIQIQHEVRMTEIQREGEKECERIHQEHLNRMEKIRKIMEPYEKDFQVFLDEERN